MRFKGSVTVIATSAVLAFAAFGILAASAASSSTFTPVVNSLSQLPATGSLAGTWCASSSSCVAVGQDENGQPLVLAGDPSTWSKSQAKEINLGSAFGSHGSLSSVACQSATSCVAVGYDWKGQPLVLAGDPSTWSAAQAREITLGSTFGTFGSLSSVSCVSGTSCVAVGGDGHGQPLVLAGDPSTWSAAQAREIALGSAFDSQGFLSSISCLSATSCVAAGSDGKAEPLTLAGDPSTWSAAQAREIALGSTFGSQGFPSSVSCLSATSCVVVGSDGKSEPLTLAGNPSTWTAAQAREIALGSSFGSQGSLPSVSCLSATSCVATGSDGKSEPLTLVGNPSIWSAAQAREVTLGSSFGSQGFLSSVACLSATSCVVVGSDGKSEPLTLAGDPSTWSAAQTTEVTLTGMAFGAQDAHPQLTCSSATACFNVGYDGGAGGGIGPFILRGNPTTWDQVTPTVMSGVTSTYGNLVGAACASATYCVAVGDDWNSNLQTSEPLALTGNPSTWGTAHGHEITLGSSLNPLHTGSSLSAVACTSSTSCVAVGEDGHNQPLVVAGNPSTWSSSKAKQITLGKSFGYGGWLVSIACASSTSCVAVGQDRKGLPLVLAGNPATWSATQARQITLGSAFSSLGSLSSVVCTSSTYCVSVGQSGSTGQLTAKAKPLVLRGNPSTWTASSAFNLPVSASSPSTVGGFSAVAGHGSGFLTSISCRSATYCVAVGGDKHAAPVYIAGNPKTWTGTSTLARPATTGSFKTARLTSSYCTSTVCFVDGYSNGGDFVATVK